MNLLEEILDSLNTTAIEQGKLSAAKSLDFFRSTEDLDYKAPVIEKGSFLKGLIALNIPEKLMSIDSLF